MFHSLYKSLTRRDLLALAGGALVPVFTGTTAHAGGKSASDSGALFFKPTKTPMWDTWMYQHRDTIYLYYLIGTQLKWNGVGLAISRDGVHWEDRGRVIQADAGVAWLGSGAVWPAKVSSGQEQKFIMNFSEWRGSDKEGRQTIFFAESLDLIHWKRLGPEYEFKQDTRWYESHGRWDCIYPLPRPGGGFYGYWTAQPKDNKAGVGFGESLDGMTWRALEPATLLGAKSWTEIAAVHTWKNKYYAMTGHVEIDAPGGNAAEPGGLINTFIGDSPAGPFKLAQKNRILMVGNASYFCRFVDIPGEVLVNHQSWLPVTDSKTDFAKDVHLAPLKRAVWDDEGTLRLMWWQGNERAKKTPVRVALLEAAAETKPTLLNVHFDQGQTLILEGVFTLQESANAVATGLYLQGSGETGTAFLVQENGAVAYGNIRSDGTQFEQKGRADRELALNSSARFRLIRKGRMTEFYLNDALMQCYCLPEHGTGRLGVLGAPNNFSQLAAWYCQ